MLFKLYEIYLTAWNINSIIRIAFIFRGRRSGQLFTAPVRPNILSYVSLSSQI